MQVKKTCTANNHVLNDNHVLNFPIDLLPIDPSLSLSIKNSKNLIQAICA